MKADRETIPGSGLPMPAFFAVLTGSVVLFLVYDGLLWKAPREASHVARFVVSYLAVIPLSAGLLVAVRRFTWAHLVTSTFAIWAIKMVITAALYQAFARGTATRLQAVAPPATAMMGTAAAPRAEYHAADATFAAGAIRGHVKRGGDGVPGAVVFVDTPRPGRSAPAHEAAELVVSRSRYAEPLYLVHVDDEVRLLSKDGVLHTAHFSGSGTIPPTRALPPGAEPPIVTFTEPGVFRVRCDNHEGESAWLVVVDHPYATRTGEGGAFAIDGVPAGEARVSAVVATAAGARRVDAVVSVPVRGAASLEPRSLERAGDSALASQTRDRSGKEPFVSRREERARPRPVYPLYLAAPALLALAACTTDDWKPEVLRDGKSVRAAGVLRHGREQYSMYCAGCHGENGDGEGPASRFMSPKPRDFRKGRVKFAAVPANTLPRDEDLLNT